MRIKKFGADMEADGFLFRIGKSRWGTRKTVGACNNLRDCPVCQEWTRLLYVGNMPFLSANNGDGSRENKMTCSPNLEPCVTSMYSRTFVTILEGTIHNFNFPASCNNENLVYIRKPVWNLFKKQWRKCTI